MCIQEDIVRTLERIRGVQNLMYRQRGASERSLHTRSSLLLYFVLMYWIILDIILRTLHLFHWTCLSRCNKQRTTICESAQNRSSPENERQWLVKQGQAKPVLAYCGEMRGAMDWWMDGNGSCFIFLLLLLLEKRLESYPFRKIRSPHLTQRFKRTQNMQSNCHPHYCFSYKFFFNFISVKDYPENKDAKFLFGSCRVVNSKLPMMEGNKTLSLFSLKLIWSLLWSFDYLCCWERNALR